MSTGLRERKKGATKDALSQAALDLALERGVDAVTAESIAEAADVSTRTFHNYFSSKEDAILFVLNKTVEGMVGAFCERSPSEPVLDSLEAVLIGMLESSGLERLLAVTRLMAEHPALIARHVAVFDSTDTLMVAEIGRRTATDPNSELYPRLVYHATAAVARAVVEQQIAAGSDAEPSRRKLADSVREGFAQLRRGLPQPSTSTNRRA
jgi:AcrR family transcriptional regulator